MDENVIRLIAERKIQEAVDEGQFDNLPGKGKPIVFDDDPMTPPHLRMMNKILKNAGVLPDWVQVQKEIVTEREQIILQRERLVQENRTRQERALVLPTEHPGVQKFAVWRAKSRAAYLRRLKTVNDTILKFNLTAPSTVPVYKPYKITEEMEIFDAAFAAPAVPSADAGVLETNRKPGALKSLARERYGSGGAACGQFPAGSGADGFAEEDIRRVDVPEAWKRRE